LFPPTRKLLLRRIRKSLEERLRSGSIQVSYLSGMPGGGPVGWPGGPTHGGRGEEDDPGHRAPGRPGEIVIDQSNPDEE
jgi:hypothetical protein